MNIEEKFEAIKKLQDQGEFDKALQLVIELEKEVQGNDDLLVRIIAIKARILYLKGNLDEGLKLANKGLAIVATLNPSEIKKEKFSLLRLKSIILSMKGDKKIALEMFDKNVGYTEEIGDKEELLTSLIILGFEYANRGILKEALKSYQDSLVIAKELNNRFNIAHCLLNIGGIYSKYADQQDIALKYFDQCLEHRDEFKKHPIFARALAEKITIYLIRDERESALASLQIIEKFLVTSTSKYYQLFYDESKALYLKSSKRTRDKAQAEVLFQKIVDDDVIFIGKTIIAMEQLAELFLFEYKTYEEQEVLDEIIELINKMYNLAQDHQMPDILVKSLVLRAKVLALDGDFDKAFKILDQAFIIAEENEFTLLKDQVTQEQKLLNKNLSNLQALVNENASVAQKMESLKFTDYFEEVQKLKLNFKS